MRGEVGGDVATIEEGVPAGAAVAAILVARLDAHALTVLDPVRVAPRWCPGHDYSMGSARCSPRLAPTGESGWWACGAVSGCDGDQRSVDLYEGAALQTRLGC
jgi:hypothetical protein